MSMVRIAVIVEGDGEVEAVPILLRRIAEEIDPTIYLDIKRPIRKPASKLKKTGELEKNVELAVRLLKGIGGIIILLDCDGDGECPKNDAPLLLSRAKSVRPDYPITVVLAYKEYETWFIAAAESLKNKGKINGTIVHVSNPERIRGAKEWLSRYMPPNRPYAETIDQPAFTALFDMQAARCVDSFNKCWREVESMIGLLRKRTD